MFILYGAGGHAKVILDILRARNAAVDFVCDDDPALAEFCGLPVVRGRAFPAGAAAIVGIGKNETRRKIAMSLRGRGAVFATAVHPSAVVSPEAEIGAGTVVMPGALVNAGTRVGEHCIVNTGASVDHDCRIGDFAHVSPHATLCGNVSVGEGSWIGAGTVVIQGVSIGKNCLVGAGSVVSKNIPDNAFACGNRCKILKQIPPPQLRGNEIIFFGGSDFPVASRNSRRGKFSEKSFRQAAGMPLPQKTFPARFGSAESRLGNPGSANAANEARGNASGEPPLLQFSSAERRLAA